jgi:large subunit ribosomal protein L9
MKVFLLKNVERIGIAGEIIKVADGYAKNFLFPHKLAVEVKPENEKFYEQRVKTVENRKEVVSTQTSMLSEQINGKKFVLKKKVHDHYQLFLYVNERIGEVGNEVADVKRLIQHTQKLFNVQLYKNHLMIFDNFSD